MVSHPQQEDSRAEHVLGALDSEFLHALPEARRGVTCVENE